MARQPRLNVPGIHHVFARGNDRGAIFRDDLDREAYLAILGRTLERMGWDCLAYCLMDNHVHLLVEIFEANLGAGIQRLHGLYGLSFNEHHGRTGHVFQGRYGSKLVTSDEQLWTTLAYVVRNPVSAGLCDSPEEWRWSSHAAAMSGGGPRWFDRTVLLRCFEGVVGDPRTRYAELTEAG